ncbi:ubiquitin-protein ligase RMD5 ASCRUDRAFT_8847 [Ascoidea rubescens DSM 1968]|uniref:CTLH/CRA C-terminal to LisH motif domain-containing protein n=1 Tax=Ascoidea rubescens DSM 1968 TaxID=1344418 RepID=A0A1D2VF27_9ASCO|nr:hypothetical protein ASCRUDRAFT_8847 [Ascoidea rubescens DSM 1968]ODV60077.1 hypothetical protein ASCRUDRAFT_8847 [Ascoidea rubescens DSM 1968]
MSTSDFLLLDLLNQEYNRFSIHSPLNSSSADTKELISYLKNIKQHLQSSLILLHENQTFNVQVEEYDKLIQSKLSIWQDSMNFNLKKSHNSTNKFSKFLDNRVFNFNLKLELNKFNMQILNGSGDFYKKAKKSRTTLNDIGNHFNLSNSTLNLSNEKKKLVNQIILNHLVLENNSNCFSLHKSNQPKNQTTTLDNSLQLQGTDCHQSSFMPTISYTSSHSCSDYLISLLESQFNYKISHDFKSKLVHLKQLINPILNPLPGQGPNLNYVLHWCQANHSSLSNMNSDLVFNLQILKFSFLYNGILGFHDISNEIMPNASKNTKYQFSDKSIDEIGQNHKSNPTIQNNHFNAYLYCKNNLSHYFSNKLVLSPENNQKLLIISNLFAKTFINDEIDIDYFSKDYKEQESLPTNYINQFPLTINQFIETYFLVNNLNLNSNLYSILISSFISLPSLFKFNSINSKLMGQKNKNVKKSASKSFSAAQRDFYFPILNTRDTFVPRNRSYSEHILPYLNRYTNDLNNDNEDHHDLPSDQNDFIANFESEKHWTSKDELPIEIELPKFLNHNHPIFICPVSKQEVTKKNPPILLPCKHIISEEALIQLSSLKSSRGYNSAFDNDDDNDDDENYDDYEPGLTTFQSIIVNDTTNRDIYSRQNFNRGNHSSESLNSYDSNSNDELDDDSQNSDLGALDDLPNHEHSDAFDSGYNDDTDSDFVFDSDSIDADEDYEVDGDEDEEYGDNDNYEDNDDEADYNNYRNEDDVANIFGATSSHDPLGIGGSRYLNLVNQSLLVEHTNIRDQRYIPSNAMLLRRMAESTYRATRENPGNPSSLADPLVLNQNFNLFSQLNFDRNEEWARIRISGGSRNRNGNRARNRNRNQNQNQNQNRNRNVSNNLNNPRNINMSIERDRDRFGNITIRIDNQNSHRRRKRENYMPFKCPYCPTMCRKENTTPVYFC